MTTLTSIKSIGFSFALEIALTEAATSRHTCAAPEHLLIGVCKIANYLGDSSAAPANLTAGEAAEFKREAEAIGSLFDSFRQNRVGFYREVRRAFGIGAPLVQNDEKVTVSAASQAVLEAAGRLAAPGKTVNSLHLLAALLGDGKGTLVSLLREKRVETEMMRRAALQLAGQIAASIEAPETEPAGTIVETLDAEASGFSHLRPRANESPGQLALLYDLPLRLGASTRLEQLLQSVVEQLVKVIPNARRGALLLVDKCGGANELVLRAYQPRDRWGTSMTLAKRALDRRQAFIWQQNEEGGPPSALVHGIGTAMYAPLLWRGEALGVICIDHPDREKSFAHDDLGLLIAAARYAAMAVAHQRASDDLRRHSELTARLFSSRFPPQVRENIAAEAAAGSLPLGTRQSHIAVLLADIRAFTELTRQIGAQRMSDLLNELFPALIQAIHAHSGTIGRLVGDSILAVFGSPQPDKQAVENAVRAATAMQRAASALMESRAARRLATCEIGIGVDCGEALHGFIGNADWLEYAVVGDVPNYASRYCSAAGRGEILISEDVHSRVFNKVSAERMSISTKDGKVLVAFRVAAC